jgi:hypothetical protein
MLATDMPRAGADGVGRFGRRSALRWVTAIIEFNVVSGSCPNPASTLPTRISVQLGTNTCGRHIRSVGRFSGGTAMIAVTTPSKKTAKAYGNRFNDAVSSSTMNAAAAPRRLSCHGDTAPRGLSKLLPAERISDNAAPTCMPLTTGIGMILVNHCRSPVTLKKSTAMLTKRPADAVSALVRLRDIATAAMAFIGCTGRGMANTRPVMMLKHPVKMRVVESEIDSVMERAMRRGRRVPRSPREPDISCRGEERNVFRLY